jgi:SAM-dependent MidA family methyltransferase
MEAINPSVSTELGAHIAQRIQAAGGWLGFDEYMALALYAPGLGYYSNSSRKFGHMPPRRLSDGSMTGGSDFVTAPELSPLFGACVGEQIAQALQATGTHCVYEFGAGSGALALQICEQLTQQNSRLEQYFIVDVSGSLRARQQVTLQHLQGQVTWLDALPEHIEGVIVGNEVLDAMPVKLLARLGGVWHERGVVLANGALAWQDRATTLRPPLEIDGPHDYLSEIHPQAEAFIRTVAGILTRGAAFFIDYGFPEAEYYHPQRHMGTLMCHRAHQSDPNPLELPGEKDITAHINFTGVALAAQEAGLDVLGYTTQARFLMNCGMLQKLELLGEQIRRLEAVLVQKLLTEHEMGELFKVIAFSKGVSFDALGFLSGDKTHTL